VVPTIPVPSGPAMSTKDINLLKELAGKIPDIELRIELLTKLTKSINVKTIEESIKDLYSKLDQKAGKKELEELSEIVKKLREDLDSVQEQTNENTTEINKLKSRLDLVETKIVQITKTITELSAKIEKGTGRKEVGKEQNLFAQNAGGAHIEEEDWNEVKKNIERLKKEIADLIKELDSIKELKKRVHTLEGLMDTKMDKEEFEKWRLSNDINQILGGLLKKFADRNEMLKSLKKIDSRLTIMEEMISKEGGVVDSGENAMLAKKPLGGWSCASCQKDLINIEGLKVQYYPWAKLPQRNPAERIAKVRFGQHLYRWAKDFQECCQC